ncbi:KEOPS complex component [Halobacteriales archaeon QS_8_69_26]|nr:MAG: KEOPS complex component [Halobacteriales archaeon QS_8_69_26]
MTGEQSPVDLEPAVDVRVVTGTARVGVLDAFLADLSAVGTDHGCTVQAFDARLVAGPVHLRRAVALADRAFARGENVARERAVGFLLYAAGRRQIDDALAMGVDEGETPVAVLVAADPDGSDPDGDDPDTGPDCGDPDPEAAASAVAALPAVDEGPVEFGDPDRIRSFFDIEGRELAATDATLDEVVLERVALLDVEK